MTKSTEQITTYELAVLMPAADGVAEPSLVVTRQDWTMTPKMGKRAAGLGDKWEMREQIERRPRTIQAAIAENLEWLARDRERLAARLKAIDDQVEVLGRVHVDGDTATITPVGTATTPAPTEGVRSMPWRRDDGGRAAAGFGGKPETVGDCVVRAIAIATGKPYREVYDALFALGKRMRAKNPSPRNGVAKKVSRAYMASLGGWEWVPTMQIGQGCKVHLCAEELPAGRLVVAVSRHYVAVVDGIAHDRYDPSRDGRRCVYGYWRQSC